MSQSTAAQIRDLKARLATEQERRTRVREYWFPWPGHPAGEFCGVSLESLDGQNWALVQHAQFAGVTAWDGKYWQAVFPEHRSAAYCWPLETAERLAPLLAADQGRRFGAPSSRVDLAKHLARVTERAMDATRDFLGAVSV